MGPSKCMKITINPVLDMETLQWIANDGVYEYCGPMVRYCWSGGDVGANDKQLMAANATAAKTSTANYFAALGAQSQIANKLATKADYMAANPLGYTPEQLHAATSSINQNISTAARQAIGKAAGFAAAHGASDVGGGAAGMEVGQIAEQAAGAKATQLAELSRQNQEMKQQNLYAALSTLKGAGSEFGGVAGTAAGAAGEQTGASLKAGEGEIAAKQAQAENVGAIIQSVAGGATGIGSGLANLDTTGSSTGGEQAKNFLAGFAGV